MSTSFGTALQAAADRFGWNEEVRAAIAAREADLLARPDEVAREIATSFVLPLEDEVALRTLGAPPQPPPRPPPKKTVWVQDTPSQTERPPPPPPKPARRETRRIDGRTLASLMREPLDEHSVTDAIVALAAMAGNGHRRGIVYRNLGPSNVLVGDLGEVVVRDPAAEPVASCCAPELARDPGAEVTPAADVFSLGCMLYEAISGVSWFARVGREATLQAVLDDDRRTGEREVPRALMAVCVDASHPDPADRYPDGRAFADALRTALATGEPAGTPEVPEVRTLDAARAAREDATVKASVAREALGALGPTSTLEQKRDAWAVEQAAREAAVHADHLEAVALDELVAVAWSRGGDADHDAVAEHLHAMAEREQELGEVSPERVDAVARHDRSGRYGAWCAGTGKLTLLTEHPAEVELYRYEARERRLWPTPARALGTTPLKDVPVEPGSWVCIVRTRDGRDARVPVWIRRRTHWHGIPPGGDAPRPIRLPDTSEVPEGAVYVPAGWFRCGAPDPAALPDAWVWVDGFAIQQHPVPMQAYVDFLTALRNGGRKADAERFLPAPAPSGSGLWPRVAWRGRRYELLAHLEDRPWEPGWPAAGVPFAGAVEYARWRAESDRIPWRLPRELEWEKAARGVDGRPYPWGWEVDPLFARYQASAPADPDAFPADSSPYGVRGMAGNVRDWVDEPWRPPAAGFRLTRGGDFANGPGALSVTRRTVFPESGSPLVGFRLARTIPG